MYVLTVVLVQMFVLLKQFTRLNNTIKKEKSKKAASIDEAAFFHL